MNSTLFNKFHYNFVSKFCISAEYEDVIYITLVTQVDMIVLEACNITGTDCKVQCNMCQVVDTSEWFFKKYIVQINVEVTVSSFCWESIEKKARPYRRCDVSGIASGRTHFIAI
jgi:hypothetical protein